MSLDLTEIDDDGPLYAAAKKVYPQRVWGTYRRIKWIVLCVALGVYYILPFIRWNGPSTRMPGVNWREIAISLIDSDFGKEKVQTCAIAC